MNSFDNLSLRWKLILNFLGSGGVLFAAIIYCLFQIDAVGRDSNEMARQLMPSVQTAAEISQLRLRYRVRSLEYLLSTTDDERAKIEKSLNDLDTSLSAALLKYEPLADSSEERSILKAAVEGVAAYRRTVSEAVAFVKEGKVDEAQQLRRTSWVKAANEVRDQTDALQEFNRKATDAAAVNTATMVSTAIRGGSFALVVSLVLAIILTLLIQRRISRHLDRAITVANAVAQGDLTGQLPEAGKDEIGKLMATIGRMRDGLRDAMRETAQSSRTILDAAQQLDGAMRQMDHSAGLQSDAASAIAASVEELTVSINVVSDSSSEAARLATASDQQAGVGRDAIEHLMGQINEVAAVVRTSSEQIGQLQQQTETISSVVAVIKDIADQTNLLALNAAIEAARAGEHGRGFAVVADEVRKLSERTGQSTGQITQTVNAIQTFTGEVVAGFGHGVQLVESSVNHARQASEAIGGLRDMARQVSAVVSELEGALREQSIASTDVARQIEQIASQSEEVSAIARQTAHSSVGLAQTSRDMEAQVARFRV